jgi:Ca2+/Na+ antiporter
MSPDQLGGWIGGVLGVVFGLAGGGIGTYFSIRNTNGPRERRFMVHAATVIWVLIVAFFVLLVALPSPWRWLLWIPYSILLPIGIILGNRRQQQIRGEETSTASV